MRLVNTCIKESTRTCLDQRGSNGVCCNVDLVVKTLGGEIVVERRDFDLSGGLEARASPFTP